MNGEKVKLEIEQKLADMQRMKEKTLNENPTLKQFINCKIDELPNDPETQFYLGLVRGLDIGIDNLTFLLIHHNFTGVRL
jgi:hypothetical protein